MTDIVIPAALRHARNSFRYIDSTGVARGTYTGAAQTTGYGGDRVGATIGFTPHGGRLPTDRRWRSQLQAFLMSLRGKQNRVFVTDESYTLAGSFPATELLTNADFSSGTTGYTSGSVTMSAADGVFRATALNPTLGMEVYQQPAATLYVPYVLRSVIVDGAQSSAISIGNALSGTSVGSSSVTATRGYLLSSIVTDSTTLTAYVLRVDATNGYTAGAYALLPFTSLSRCFLVDGAANLLLQSDALNTGANWTPSGCTVGVNSAVAPDGTTTADSIVESNSSNVEHYIQQTVAVAADDADITLSVAIAPNGRSWAVISMVEGTGSTGAYVFINLTTGALGTIGTGANWANSRATVRAFGTYYVISLTSRKTNAATSIQAFIESATADNSFTYAGSAATDAIRIWRPTLSLSSLTTRLRQTTTTAATAEEQTGSAIYVKGLPVSTAGLLLAGDWVEIDGQLKMVTASLNSDASGLGYLQFSPPLRRAVSDNTPIIVHRPMGRFLYAGDNVGWDNEPGVFSAASIDLEEAFS